MLFDEDEPVDPDVEPVQEDQDVILVELEKSQVVGQTLQSIFTVICCVVIGRSRSWITFLVSLGHLAFLLWR